MKIFKIILDGTELQDEPLELDKIKFQLIRDDVIRGLVLKVTSVLTFTGDGYHLLLDKRKNSVCDAIPVIIQHRCSDEEPFITLFEGNIILSQGDDVQFNPIKCQVEAKIEDANFGAKIENNKKIKAYVGTPTSKNGLEITAASVTDLRGFNIATGAPSGSTREGYSVFECFRFLVEFMSDGSLTFASDFFSTGEGKDWFIITGERIRNNTGDSVYVSFEDLFEEMFIQTNASFSIESGTTIRIEPENDLFSNSTAETIQGITDVVEYLDPTKFYDRIIVGSENVDITGTYPEEFRFVGWNEEEYHLLGECNSGESLSLLSENFILDHNSIVTSLGGGTEDDDANFLMWANSTTGNAIGEARFGLQFFYNATFTNEFKIKRHFGAIPNSIALFLGEPGVDDAFRAALSSTQSFLNINNSNPSINQVIQFNDVTAPPTDVFDTDGNYNVAGFKYIAPVDGMYNFRGAIVIRHEVVTAINKSTQSIRHTIEIERLDSGDVVIGVIGTGSINTNAGRNAAGSVNNDYVEIFVDTGGIPLTGGDRIRVKLNSSVVSNSFNPTTDVFIDTSSRFLTLATNEAFGVVETFNIEDVRGLISEFQPALTRSQFINILNNTNQKLVISGANNYHRNGWIDELEFSLNSDSTIKLISNGS